MQRGCLSLATLIRKMVQRAFFFSLSFIYKTSRFPEAGLYFLNPSYRTIVDWRKMLFFVAWAPLSSLFPISLTLGLFIKCSFPRFWGMFGGPEEWFKVEFPRVKRISLLWDNFYNVPQLSDGSVGKVLDEKAMKVQSQTLSHLKSWVHL